MLDVTNHIALLLAGNFQIIRPVRIAIGLQLEIRQLPDLPASLQHSRFSMGACDRFDLKTLICDQTELCSADQVAYH